MKYYRYSDVVTRSGVKLFCHSFDLIKETPKGVWIESLGLKHFVRQTAKKQYAYSTKEAALESFRARKKRQIQILERRLRIAKLALIAEPNEIKYLDKIDVDYNY